jgi:hypothetical protein
MVPWRRSYGKGRLASMTDPSGTTTNVSDALDDVGPFKDLGRWLDRCPDRFDARRGEGEEMSAKFLPATIAIVLFILVSFVFRTAPRTLEIPVWVGYGVRSASTVIAADAETE